MGLFDIFRKKKNNVEPESTTTSESLSESQSETLSQSNSETTTSSALTQPVMEQVGLVDEHEADEWSKALDKKSEAIHDLPESESES